MPENLLPGSHFSHLNKDFFLQKHFVQYMRNNFVTDQFNITKLTGCRLEKIQKDLAKQKFKNCERRTGED